MPTLTSRGAASARGFGLLGAAPLNLQTTTFTSSSSWTAPIGVTNLTVLTGKGGDGEPASEFWAPNQIGYTAYSYEWSGAGGAIDGAPQYDQVRSSGLATIAGFNSSTADRTIVWGPSLYYYNPATQKTTFVGGDFISRRVRGTITPSSGPWDNNSSQQVKGIGNGWYFNGETFFSSPETTGGTSSAFGNTYPGGVGGAATPITTTNVSVTPGQTYGITVGAGGYVTFQYLA